MQISNRKLLNALMLHAGKELYAFLISFLQCHFVCKAFAIFVSRHRGIAVGVNLRVGR